MSQSLDPVELAAQLIRCPSVTPAEAGALDLLQSGFRKSRLCLHALAVPRRRHGSG